MTKDTSDVVARQLVFDLDRSMDYPSERHSREGRNFYNVIDWTGQHRGQVALTPEERDAISPLQPCAALISSLVAENERLTKDLAAQIAGHQLTAKQSTDNLVRANTATATLDEVETRARKHWQAFRDLRLDIIGHGPMCRDCADENGRCPHSGQPCDPDEAVKEQIANWRSADRAANSMRTELEHVSASIGSMRWMDPPDGGSVSLGEQVNRMRGDLETAERLLAEARAGLTLVDAELEEHGFSKIGTLRATLMSVRAALSEGEP